jgi:hypothetical protein
MEESPQDLLRKVFGDEGPAEPERPHNQTPLFRLSTTLPEFTAETRRTLIKCGETALASPRKFDAGDPPYSVEAEVWRQTLALKPTI